MKLTSHDQCYGCSACEFVCPQHCISMIRDQEGFLFPEIDNNKCIKCGRCSIFCPVNKYSEISAEKTEAYAAYSLNEEIRTSSSSGGIFSEFAIEILQKGGVVYGAAYDDHFIVKHIRVIELEKLKLLQGAKYSQSELGNTYIHVLDDLLDGKIVLFVGTPCQVQGLKAFLNKDYPNLICLDFVCHGIPSPIVWSKYVHYRSNKDNSGECPVSINMRSKKTGWSHYQYSSEFIYYKHAYLAQNGCDEFMNLFIGDYINRLSCNQCHARGLHRVSDITLGDFWGIWDCLPSMDDNKGTSLVLIHSPKGKEIFDTVRQRIVIRPVTYNEAIAQNPAIVKSSALKPERQYYIQQAINGNFNTGLESDSKDPGNLKSKLKKIFKSFRFR